MKDLVEKQEMGHVDISTGLYPFMLAATGFHIDLDTLFEMTRYRPELVRFHDRGDQ